MNDLLRPSLYGAQHEILTVIKKGYCKNTEAPNLVDIVGPVCETGDTFATEIEFPSVKQQELIAIKSAGAYGAVMSSTYNSRALVPEVLVKGNMFSVIRDRINIDTLMSFENLPDWL